MQSVAALFDFYAVLLRQYRVRASGLISLVLLRIVSAVVETAIYLLLIPVVLSLLLSKAEFPPPQLRQYLPDGLVQLTPSESASLLIAASVTMLLLRVGTYLSAEFTQSRLVSETYANTMRLVIEAMLWRPIEKSAAEERAAQVTLVTEDVAYAINHVMVALLVIAGETFLIAVAMLIAFMIVPKLTTAAICFSFVSTVPLLILFKNQNKKIHSRLANISAEMHHWVSCIVDGIREIKVYHSQVYIRKNIGDLIDRYVKGLAKHHKLGSIPKIWIESLAIVIMLIVGLWVWGHDANDQASSGLVGLFFVGILRVMPGASRIMTAWNYILYYTASFRRVSEILLHATINEQDVENNPSPDEVFVDLALCRVSYQFPGQQAYALSGVNLTIRQGEVWGIIGESGAGKTTLINIILGLLPVTSGTVLLNGKAGGCSLYQHVKMCGYVPQKPLLFSGTIAENICFGAQREPAAVPSLAEVLQQSALATPANADSFEKFELVYGGENVSGGQRQRIALARALVRESQFLVLDEISSSLDFSTEEDICRTLGVLFSGRTAVIVTHRSALARLCTHMLVLKKGHVEASGEIGAVLEKSGFARAFMANKLPTTLAS